jgi:hypothetical protein
MLSVHVEVLPHLQRTLSFIKSLGAAAGAVLNPSTPVSAVSEVAMDVDFVLVMTVNRIRRSGLLPTASLRSGGSALLDEAVPGAHRDRGIDLATVGKVVAAGRKSSWPVRRCSMPGSGTSGP